jgi:hypothetical protein
MKAKQKHSRGFNAPMRRSTAKQHAGYNFGGSELAH